MNIKRKRNNPDETPDGVTEVFDSEPAEVPKENVIETRIYTKTTGIPVVLYNNGTDLTAEIHTEAKIYKFHTTDPYTAVNNALANLMRDQEVRDKILITPPRPHFMIAASLVYAQHSGIDASEATDTMYHSIIREGISSLDLNTVQE